MATSCPADMATDPYERAEPKFSGAAMWGAAGGKWSWRIAKKWILPTPLPASNFLNLRPTQLRSEKSLSALSSDQGEVMEFRKICLLLSATSIAALILAATLSLRDSDSVQASGAAIAHDGRRDFDFEIGNWKTHLRRLQHPLSGSSTWIEYNGTSAVRKVWGGKANLVELEVDGPAGHLEALSLRLYNPETHQWSLNSANSKGRRVWNAHDRRIQKRQR
jgi:hypothetical protein